MPLAGLMVTAQFAVKKALGAIPLTHLSPATSLISAWLGPLDDLSSAKSI